MIDIERTRTRMLAELDAPTGDGWPQVTDPADPGFLSPDGVRLVLRGHTRDELMPGLKSAFRRRFTQVPKEHLDEDLLDLLKKGLGNAWKRGNREREDRWITVEVAASRRGALVAIGDEGDGFDVAGVVGRFRSNEQYFHHRGTGLSCFHKSRSVVSWERGGRTLLICFRTRPGVEHRADVDGEDATLRTRFAEEIPFFRRNGLEVESCRSFAADKEAGEAQETRYVVGCRKRDGSEKSVAMLARSLPPGAAEREFAVARVLHRGPLAKQSGIRIPKPMGVIAEPSMLLYRLEVDRTLRDRAKRIERFRDLERLLRSIATALRVLHASSLSLDAEEGLDAELQRHRAIQRRLEERLPAGGRRERLARSVEGLERGAARLGAWERAPIHGAFGWDAVVLDRNRHAYLYRFDQCRRSHPGLDLGGFLADLLRFYVLRDEQDREFYSRGREVFVSAYVDGRTPPWEGSLDWFVAGGLLRRLERLLARPEGKWEPKVDALLEQLERSLDVGQVS